jgi:hypothetical protein
MLRRREFWLTAGALLLLVVALVIALEPTHVVRGFLCWEAFYRGRPTSYWRETLRADGQNGHVRPETVATFRIRGQAAPVLAECLQDSDPNVRWPAAYLLGNGPFVTQLTVPPLRRALHDPDKEVHLQAIYGLGLIGANARQATNELADLYRDPDAQIRHYADVALWRVHAPAARRAGGWQEVKSPEWGFTAEFPHAPEIKDRTFQLPRGAVVGHTFQAAHGVTQCIVMVADYPEELVKATTEEDRFEGMASMVGLGLEANLVSNEAVVQGTHTGRQLVIETPLGAFRNRLFWVGNRQYAVMVVFDPRFLNATAADYFLDSLHIE